MLRTGDEYIIYGNIYDSIRLGCEAILLLAGYRIESSSQSHHYETINMASVLMSGELVHEFNNFYYIYAKNSFKKFFNPAAD
ncbi:hypothetical protein KKH16_02200 [Patescibacteria group bacterium]|nr:hypothetical protein [Patescibacteria group bacterium]MBU1870589.1 hypothetical protein [Patescibacteria group bacterium]